MPIRRWYRIIHITDDKRYTTIDVKGRAEVGPVVACIWPGAAGRKYRARLRNKLPAWVAAHRLEQRLKDACRDDAREQLNAFDFSMYRRGVAKMMADLRKTVSERAAHLRRELADVERDLAELAE